MMTPDLNEDSNSNSIQNNSNNQSGRKLATASSSCATTSNLITSKQQVATTTTTINLKRKNLSNEDDEDENSDENLNLINNTVKSDLANSDDQNNQLNYINKNLINLNSQSNSSRSPVSDTNNLIEDSKQSILVKSYQNSTNNFDSGIKTRSQKAKAALLLLKSKTNDNELITEKQKLNTPKLQNKSTHQEDNKLSNQKEQEDWLKIFSNWNNKTKLNALEKILELCDHTHIKYVHNFIEPKLQRDYISELPKELIFSLITYIRPKDLFKLAQVSIFWNQIANDSIIWKNICKKYRINLNVCNDLEHTIASIPSDTEDQESESKTKKFKNSRLNNKVSSQVKYKAPYDFLNSFNQYKRAYLIDSNVTRNWCTRPLPRPLMLKSHDDHVITCLKFDGKRVVSGSDDNTLKIWCAQTGKLIHTLTGHSGGVWASQLKDNIVVSGSTDRTVRVWNIDTGECIHVLTGHTSTVRCLALNGTICISGSRDSLLRVWDIETGQCLQVLRGHQAAVRCVCFDGNYVVSGSYDFTIRVWNPFKNECIHVLEGHINRVYSLLFDGNRIVSGSLDTTIIVWDVHTGAIIHKLTGHHSLTSGMQIKGDILVSGNADSTVKIWSLKTGECLHTLSGCNKHMSAVTCLAFNDKFVVSSSDDGTVKLWNLETGEFIRNLLALESGGRGGVVWRISMNKNKLVCAVGSRIGVEETKLILLDFDWPCMSLINQQPVINNNIFNSSNSRSSQISGLQQILTS